MLKITQSGIYESKEHFSSETTPLRSVKEFELELYEGGEGFCVVNGIKYSHKNPHIMVSTPGDMRFSIGMFECRCVHFVTDSKALCDLLEKCDDYIPLNDVHLFRELFQNTEKRFEDTELDEMFRQGAVLELVSSVKEHSGKKKKFKENRYSENILATKEYMDNNFGEKITLEMLASSVFMSKNFYRTVFENIMEMSPQRYLTGIRVSNAISLIRKNVPYKEIAQICGFDSQAYMNFVIKKETGKTPSQYRK